MTRYYLEIRDQSGNVVDYLTQESFSSLSYTRKLNTYGEMTIVFPYSKYIEELFKIDTMIGVYRDVLETSPKLDGDTLWLVRKTTNEYSGTSHTFNVIARDALSLLERRIIVYNSGNAYTHKLDHADNVAKAVMREGYGSLCLDTTRDLSSLIHIDSDQSLCDVLRIELTRTTLLQAVTDIADMAYQLGTPMYFDMIYTPDIDGFTFRTYALSRGIDLSASSDAYTKVILGLDYRNISDNVLTVDYSDEWNYVYYGGTGVGDIIAVAAAYDVTRMRLTPYSRIEKYTSGTLEAPSSEEIENEAKKVLIQGKPKITFDTKILNIPGSLYGYDFNFGDKISIQHSNIYYDVTVMAYTINVTSSGEEIEVTLDYGVESVVESGAL